MMNGWADRMEEGGEYEGLTQSISLTGSSAFSLRYFQIGWVSGPFTSPYLNQHDP